MVSKVGKVTEKGGIVGCLVTLAVLASGLFALGELVMIGASWLDDTRVSISEAIDQVAQVAEDVLAEPHQPETGPTQRQVSTPSQPSRRIDARMAIGLPVSGVALIAGAVLAIPLIRRCQLVRLAVRASSLRVCRCPACGRRCGCLILRAPYSPSDMVCPTCAKPAKPDTRVAVRAVGVAVEIGG